MPLCTIPAPLTPEGARLNTRPILLVKYHQLSLGYAKFNGGHYEFEADELTCKAVDDGRLTISFEVNDDGVFVAVLLTDTVPTAGE